MAAKIAEIRAPHEAAMSEVLGRTDALLYRRGNFNGTLDDVICEAMLERRDAEIALSPGFRWGRDAAAGRRDPRRGRLQRHRHDLSGHLPHGHDRRNASRRCSRTWPTTSSNPDPYYQQGGDMVRVGGVSYAIDVLRADGLAHLRPDARAHGRAAGGRAGIRGRRLGEHQTRTPRARRSGTS